MQSIKDISGVLTILDDAFDKLAKDLWNKALSEGINDLDFSENIIQYKNDYFNSMQGALYTYSILEETKNEE